MTVEQIKTLIKNRIRVYNDDEDEKYSDEEVHFGTAELRTLLASIEQFEKSEGVTTFKPDLLIIPKCKIGQHVWFMCLNAIRKAEVVDALSYSGMGKDGIVTNITYRLENVDGELFEQELFDSKEKLLEHLVKTSPSE